RQYRGLFQVNVVLPIGSGSRAAEQIGAELDALFPVNLTIASGGLAVRVRTPISSGQPTTGDADHTVPISLGYDVQFYPE
ncbi:phage tail terminator-like protein, partial [Bordetella bronchiseptica]